jgi:hypothetical protein
MELRLPLGRSTFLAMIPLVVYWHAVSFLSCAPASLSIRRLVGPGMVDGHPTISHVTNLNLSTWHLDSHSDLVSTRLRPRRQYAHRHRPTRLHLYLPVHLPAFSTPLTGSQFTVNVHWARAGTSNAGKIAVVPFRLLAPDFRYAPRGIGNMPYRAVPQSDDRPGAKVRSCALDTCTG